MHKALIFRDKHFLLIIKVSQKPSAMGTKMGTKSTLEANKFGELICNFIALLLSHMSIDIHGRLNIGMTKTILNFFDGQTSFEKKRAMGMPETMHRYSLEIVIPAHAIYHMPRLWQGNVFIFYSRKQ